MDDVESALSTLYMYAPDCVVKEINDSLNFESGTVPKMDFYTKQKIKLILHNDINNPEICDITLEPSDFLTVLGWGR